MKPLQSRFPVSKTAFSVWAFCALVALSNESVAAPDASSAAAPTVSASAAEEKLGASIQDALGTPGVKVRVFTAKNGTTTAVLSGNLGAGKEAEVEKLVARAAKLAPAVVGRVVSLMLPQPSEKTAPVAAREPIVTAIWPRTFVSTSVTSTKPKMAGSESDASTSDVSTVGQGLNRAQELAQALNELHGGDDKTPFIKAQGPATFYLRGPHSKIVEIKRDLMKIDAAWPQVQLDLWTVQVSGSPQSIAKNAARIRERFDLAGKAMSVVQSALGDAAQQSQFFDSSDDLLKTTDDGWLQRIGFNPDCTRPLSLTEALIFLGLQTVKVDAESGAVVNGSTLSLDAAGQVVRRPDAGPLPPATGKTVSARLYSLDQMRRIVAAKFNANESLFRIVPDRFKSFDKVKGKMQVDPQRLLPVLSAAYSSNPASDRAGIKQFALAAYDFNQPGGNGQSARSNAQKENDIARLRSTAAASDRLLKAATDAFAADMQDMFLRPIFEDVAKNGGSSDSGVVLTGQARMVVSSRIETGVSPVVTSYVDTTRPKPLGIEFLSSILGTAPAAGSASEAATPASPVGTAGELAGLFSRLNSSQLLLLGAALAQPEPEITRVAPGVAINVRPTVLPDGGSARLQLDFNFGVASEVTNPVAKGDGRLISVPADGIKSNHVATDITVSAFDLFTVSSFSLESSHPRSRYLPIIGSIPLLGEIIKKPRKNKVTRHESIVLVNATILPRIMDLAHFYGQ